MGDVGGLDGILTSLAVLALNKYNTLSLKSILLTKLYKTSRETYKKKRKSSDPFKKPISKKLLKEGIVTDFDGREALTPANNLTVCARFWKCNFARDKTEMLQYKRGARKLYKDLDFVRMIKKQRQHTIQLWCLMTEAQRRFSYKLAECVLSEYSTLDDEKLNDNPQMSGPESDLVKKKQDCYVSDGAGSDSGVNYDSVVDQIV